MSGDWALLPVRAFEDGKQRLSDALSPHERAQLNSRLFRHVLTTTSAVYGPSRCAVVTRAEPIKQLAHAAGILFVDEEAMDLNLAVAQGARTLFGAGAQRITVLHCDLPLLGTDDVEALLAPYEDVVMAPDSAGTGTNAIRISRHSQIPFRFGHSSFGAHSAEAVRHGLTLATVRRHGLACDIDLPHDLALLPT